MVKQQQILLISQKQRSRAAAYSSKGADDKGKRCRSWISNRSWSKGGTCSVEHDTAEKGQCKGSRSRNPIKRYNPAERHYARKTGVWFLASSALQILQHVQMSNVKGLSIHTFSQKKNWCTSLNEKGKESEHDEVSVAIVNIVCDRPNISSDTLFQFDMSMNSLSKSDGNSEQIRRSRCPWNAWMPVKEQMRPKDQHQTLISELGESKIQGHCNRWTRSWPAARTEDLPMHHRTIKHVQSGMTSKKSYQGTEHTHLTRSVSRGKHITNMATKQGSSEITSLQSEAFREMFGGTFQRKGVHRRQVALRYIWWIILLESHIIQK